MNYSPNKNSAVRHLLIIILFSVGIIDVFAQSAFEHYSRSFNSGSQSLKTINPDPFCSTSFSSTKNLIDLTRPVSLEYKVKYHYYGQDNRNIVGPILLVTGGIMIIGSIVAFEQGRAREKEGILGGFSEKIVGTALVISGSGIALAGCIVLGSKNTKRSKNYQQWKRHFS